MQKDESSSAVTPNQLNQMRKGNASHLLKQVNLDPSTTAVGENQEN
jgi:hypothetical protein